MKDRWLVRWLFVLLLGLAIVWISDGTAALGGPTAACACGCGGTPRPFCAYRCDGNPCTGKSASQEPSPAAVAAKGCTCGCGGTPRPACAHSCGGNPCTGGALSSSRVIIGEVVEDQPATFSVVGSNGNALTGFVVDFNNGQKATTDGNGDATFTPAGHKALRCSIADVAATGVAVLTAEQASHAPTRIPRFCMTGNEMSITRAGFFDGHAENTRASIGSMPCAVLFEAPHQAILFVPAETPPGGSTLRVEDKGQKIEQPISVVRFGLQAKDRTLAKGQSTQGKAVIEGADQGLVGGVVRIQNLSTSVVTLAMGGGKANTLEKRIEPGMIQNGRIEIPFNIHATRGGSFTIVGGVFDAQALTTATCSCGCGGTPRPACAHSCGGNPCTGASIHP